MKAFTILALGAISLVSAAPTDPTYITTTPTEGPEHLTISDFKVSQAQKYPTKLEDVKFTITGNDKTAITCQAATLAYPDSEPSTCSNPDFTFTVHTAMDGSDQYYLAIVHKLQTGGTHHGRASIPLNCFPGANGSSDCSTAKPFALTIDYSGL